jgi:DNA-binding NtrC family response regulator
MEISPKDYPVLVVDDEEDNLTAFDLNFGDEFTLLTAGSGTAALELMRTRPLSVLVVDQRMPGMTGLEFLARAQEVNPGAVAVLLTAYRDIEVLVEALNSGLVYRYVHKPWDRREMAVVLRQVIEYVALQESHRSLTRRLEQLNRYLGKEVESQYNYGDIIGASELLKRLLDTLRKVAPASSTVLVTGESGTGKELAARAIHTLSPRRDGPFVRVNLAALSPTLIESELFGHEKGAFTGALAQTVGRFELADKGTLFLDEIGDLPLETQIKLLRVLQEREFERVGGTRSVRVDVRVLAATNKNLADLVRSGRFREDLYYRINVFPVAIPPLRERKEDIPLLASHFLKRFEPRVGKSFSGLTPEAVARLLGYDWPGNVRELENAIERAMIVASGDLVLAEDLSFLEVVPVWPSGSEPAPRPEAGSLPQLLDSVEKQQLAEALAKHGGSVSRMARELGINRTTLYYRLKKHGLST